MLWQENFWPEWLWVLMTNLGMLAAIVATISAFVWLWDRGPKLLIENGPDWMTRLGHYWQGRRDDE